MSNTHYANVAKIVKLLQDGDQNDLYLAINIDDEEATLQLIDDISYILISLYGTLNEQDQVNFEQRMLKEITDYELGQMRFEIEED